MPQKGAFNNIKIMENKKIRVGDEVIFVSSTNANDLLLNRMFKIVNKNNNGGYTGTLINADGITNMGYNVGYRINFNSAHKIILATREAKLEWQKELLENIKEKTAEIEAEIEFLEKYDSMEDFVADKIDLLFKADNKEARVEILKTLKQTNYL